jgi:hypothetical protein
MSKKYSKLLKSSLFKLCFRKVSIINHYKMIHRHHLLLRAKIITKYIILTNSNQKKIIHYTLIIKIAMELPALAYFIELNNKNYKDLLRIKYKKYYKFVFIDYFISIKMI